MSREIVKLGSLVTDSSTGLEGMLTHLQYDMDHSQHYIFQPKGLNPETGHPVKRLWLVPTRVVGGKRIVEPNLPLNVLGTEVEDLASGLKGMATAVVLHISGCVHVLVQPKGKLERSGNPVEPHEFDIRRLAGPAIPAMSEEEIDADQAKKPSPGALGHYEPQMPE